MCHIALGGMIADKRPSMVSSDGLSVVREFHVRENNKNNIGHIHCGRRAMVSKVYSLRLVVLDTKLYAYVWFRASDSLAPPLR
jgi:hypothetical protein